MSIFGELIRPSKKDLLFEKEMKMGIKVEMEHTTNPKIARKIALDHLREYPDYYTRLKRCVETAKPRKVLRVEHPKVFFTKKLKKVL